MAGEQNQPPSPPPSNNTAVDNANTTSTNANTAAKERNTQATQKAALTNEQLADAQVRANAESAKQENVLSAVGKAFQGVTDKITGSVELIKKFKDYLSQNQNSTASATKDLDKLSQGFAKVFAMSSGYDPFKSFTMSGGIANRTLTEQFDGIVAKTGSVQKALKAMGSVIPIPESVLNAGDAVVKSFIAQASAGQEAQRTMISMAGASGNLNSLFDSSNKLTSALTDNTTKFTAKMIEAAKGSGYSTEQIQKLAISMASIPHAMEGISSTTGMDHLTSAMKLAAGAGVDVSEVVGAMEVAYTNLSNPMGKVTDAAEKGERMFSLMATAASKLDMPFNDMKGYLDHVAGGFKMIGDNTEGAVKILSRFSGALQATGLSARASVEVITHMVDAVKGLSTGTQALISQRSGGPGGLQGAFQVEQLLRQGKTDQVAQMTERALRQQFNGRIYTQSEAASNPQAAAQFMRQRTMLQSGAFGGLAKDNESATRLLEALGKGPAATADAIKTGQEAVKQTMDRGTEIANTQLSTLNSIDTHLMELISSGTLGIQKDAQDVFQTGVDGRLGQDLKNDTIMGQVTNMRDEDGNRGAEQVQAEMGRRALGGILDDVGKVGNSIDAGLSKVKDGFGFVSKFPALAGEEGKSAREKAENEKEIAIARGAAARGATSQRPRTLGPSVARGAAQVVRDSKVDVNNKLEINVTMPPELDAAIISSDPDNTTVTLNKAALSGGAP